MNLHQPSTRPGLKRLLVCALLSSSVANAQTRQANITVADPAPVVTNFSPLSGPVGTAVLISGFNFNTDPASNIVYFGDTKATVTAASATQLNCSVPVGAGYQPLSVLNTANGLSGRSFKPFSVTFADSGNFTAHSFTLTHTISFNPSTFALYSISKDLDGDGKTDIICSRNDSITVSRNMSVVNNFIFAPAQPILANMSTTSGKFAMDDLDGDGKTDLVASTNTATVVTLQNSSSPGSISFSNRLDLPCSNGTVDVVIDDIDNDGKKDIIVGAFSTGGGISVLKNTSSPGAISFAPTVNALSGGYTLAVASGDIDGDGKVDLVSLNDNGDGESQLSCFRNTGSTGVITLSPHLDFPLPGDPTQGHTILLADVDNDDKLDVVVTNGNYFYLVMINTSHAGSISFAPYKSYSSSNSPQGITLANLSGSINPDFVTASFQTPSFTLFKNNSTPGLTVLDGPLTMGAGTYSTSAGDIDGDGKTDIISTNNGYHSVSIYQNTMGIAIPFTVCSGSNTSITSDITGTGYQWQCDSGSGFINLTAGVNVTGTSSANLQFINTPIAWNNFKYRCMANGKYSSVFIININTGLAPVVTISTDTLNICNGIPVTFTSNVSNGGTRPFYQWQVNGINSGTDSSVFTSSMLNDHDRVRVIISSNAVCSMSVKDTSNTITISMAGTIPSVHITASDTTFCERSHIVCTAFAVNPGAHPIYQWKVNGSNAGTNSNTFSSDTIRNGQTISLFLTNDPVCGMPVQVGSNTLLMHVAPVTTPADSIYISGTTDTSFCEGNNIKFASNVSNGGPAPVYQWQVNGINAAAGNSIIFNSSTLKDKDQVRMILKSSQVCITNDSAVSNSISLSIKPLFVPGITITGNATVAAGASAAISSSVTNGGTIPLYNWQDSTAQHTWQNIAGGTSALINYNPAASGDALQCVLTSSVACTAVNKVTSNAIKFNVTTVTAINTVPAETYGIKFFPNPVMSVFYIDSLKISDQWETLDITSLDGKIKITSLNIRGLTKTSLNIDKLSNGLYAAILNRKKGTRVYIKFIKQ